MSNDRVDFAAGRGYDKREYLPFHVSFEDNQSIFEEGLELVRKLWQAEDRISDRCLLSRLYLHENLLRRLFEVIEQCRTHTALVVAVRSGGRRRTSGESDKL